MKSEHELVIHQPGRHSVEALEPVITQADRLVQASLNSLLSVLSPRCSEFVQAESIQQNRTTTRAQLGLLQQVSVSRVAQYTFAALLD